jgi:hypothetical protein
MHTEFELNDIKYIDMKLVCGHDRKVSEFYPVGEQNFFGKCDDMVDTIGSCSKKDIHCLGRSIATGKINMLILRLDGKTAYIIWSSGLRNDRVFG